MRNTTSTKPTAETTCAVQGCINKARGRGWCSGHYQRWTKHGDPGATLLQRGSRPLWEALLERIELRHDGCWVWIGTITEQGYGHLWNRNALDAGLSRLAHRLAYHEFQGPIPDGMELDHTCHDPATCWDGTECLHRRCVNPAHMAVVTGPVNSLRTNHTAKTHCKHGHEYTPDNTYLNHGRRGCRTCLNARARGYRAARKEQLA